LVASHVCTVPTYMHRLCT